MAKRKPPPKVEAWEAAVEWFRNRVPMKKAEWLELDRKARERAFTVAYVSHVKHIAEIQDALTSALERGETLEDFKAAIGGRLADAHAETVFRNNIQAAYAHGREEELRDPEVLELRPYWMFSAVLDAATTEICRPLNGTILPAEHPFWKTHTPPLHHRCRSIKRSLSRRQAEERGVAKKPPPHENPDEGFGGADPLDWKPDLSGVPRNLVREYRRKTR